MASPIIAFLAGAGTGYLKQRAVEEDREREREDAKFKQEQRDVWRKQQASADSLQQRLADAQGTAEVVEGALGDQSAGPPVPAAIQPVSGAEGSQPVAGQLGAQVPAAKDPQVFRMVAPGGVNTTFNTAAEAQAAAKQYSSPEAAHARSVAAYRGAGQVDKALELERNQLQGQAAQLQLDEALLKKSNAAYDQEWMKLLSSPDQIAARLGQEMGANVKAVPSADGKTMQFVSVGQDGKQTALHAPVPNSQEGWSPLVMEQLKSIDPMHKFQFNYQQAQLKQKQANDDREFQLKQQQRADDREYKRGLLALRGAAAGGSGSAAGGAPVFDPLSDFDPKQARKAAMDQALDEAKNSASAEPVSEKQIATRAQAIYAGMRDAAAADNTGRQRAAVFASAARTATTPEEIQAIKERAMKSGFTEEEMGRIDPRFSPPPAAEVKKVVPAPQISRTSPRQEKGPPPADPAASRAAYQQFLEASGKKAASRQAQESQEKQDRFIAAQEYEERKAAERRRIAESMEAMKRNAATHSN
ncbi:MAG: hypothetical protein LBJ15_16395 [Comamonas sp.]|jgi:hypothetical protein|uniref:hypothetical protein n=1 Tax=Comamonas sp. TaxID=34028 RepID=UPI00283368CD|nr:hypothetical protein [Comamonas sp.]MDR0215563.1 hypothetical protein [Comamonas sp.]